jgi:hypothetical protein
VEEGQISHLGACEIREPRLARLGPGSSRSQRATANRPEGFIKDRGSRNGGVQELETESKNGDVGSSEKIDVQPEIGRLAAEQRSLEEVRMRDLMNIQKIPLLL